MINVHPSLLPQYRGAAPINAALKYDQPYTGVTIQELHPKKIDHGRILAQNIVSIDNTDTYPTLLEKCGEAGGDLLLDTIIHLQDRRDEPNIPDILNNVDNSAIITTKKIKKSSGQFDFNKSAKTLYNKWRSLHEYLPCFTEYKNKRMNIINMSIPYQEIESLSNVGEISYDKKRQVLLFGCGDGMAIAVTHVQLEGKKVVDAKSFAHGHILKYEK